MSHEKDLVIYAQRIQSNGYNPVDKYERKDGRWYIGMYKESGFRMREHKAMEDMDGYVYYVLKHNYDVFSSKEIVGSSDRHEGDMTIDDVFEAIFDSKEIRDITESND